MKSYVFAVSNGPVMVASASIEAMIANCKEFFAVALDGDGELRTLMGLLELTLPDETSLSPNEDFSSVIDYSEQRLPQLNEDDFEKFYGEWLHISRRESSMDEYGQLVFLKERADAWNKMASRFVLCETSRIE